MFIGILIGFLFLVGTFSALCGMAKKALEIISMIAKLFISGTVAMVISEVMNIEFSSSWGQVLFVIIGAVIGCSLMQMLAGIFRLVGYSINYFTNSFLILIVACIMGDKLQIGFLLYAVILLLYPRIVWISDRFATTTEYSHSNYSFWNNTETTYYNIVGVDRWQDTDFSWNHIPLQIAIGSVFYAIGSITITTIYPIESGWLTALYLLLTTAINIVLDLFVLRKIEEAISLPRM